MTPTPADVREAVRRLTDTHGEAERVVQLVATLLAAEREAREALVASHAVLKAAWAKTDDGAALADAVVNVGVLITTALSRLGSREGE